MVKRIGGVAILVAVLAIAAPVRADSPMTPNRSISSGAAQWVEPPAAAKPPPEPAEESADKAPTAAPPERPARQASAPPDGDAPPTRYRRAARAGARGSYTTQQLNQQQLRSRRTGSGASYYSRPYDPGFGPAPYSSSGD